MQVEHSSAHRRAGQQDRPRRAVIGAGGRVLVDAPTKFAERQHHDSLIEFGSLQVVENALSARANSRRAVERAKRLE